MRLREPIPPFSLTEQYCLELTDSGFDFSLLSEFRTRLIEGSAEQQLFEGLLSRFREKGLLKAPHKQRTDSTHILATTNGNVTLK